MAFVQKVSASANSVASIAPVLNGVTAGNTLALIVGATNNAIGAAARAVPTDSSGQTWQTAVAPISVGATSGDQSQMAIYYLLNANAGTHTVTFSLPPGSQFCGYTLVEFPACSAVDVTTSNGGTTSVTTGNTGTTAATSQANEVVLVGVTTNTTGAGLASSGFTNPPSGYTSLFVQQDTTANTGAQHSYLETSSTGTQSATWTWTSGTQTSWQAAIATFKLSAAAPANTLGRNTLVGPGVQPGKVSRQFTPAVRGFSAAAVTRALTGVQATGQVGNVSGSIAAAKPFEVRRPGPGVSPFNNGQFQRSPRDQSAVAVSNTTVALTGVQATGQVGALTASVTYGLTGVQGTGQVGNLTESIDYALTGVQGSGQVGTVVPAVSYALTGVQATGNVGAVVANVDYALTGVSATGQVGNVTTGNDVTLALTGVQATGAVGNLLANLSYSLTGNQASGQVGNLVASPTYGLTGVQATGQVGAVVSLVSYGLTGVQATGDVGTLSVPGDVTKALTGVEAVGQVGNVTATQPAIFVKGGDADKPRKKHRNHRREVRESLLRIFNGPEEVKEQAKAILRPFTKFAEVTPETVDIERLRNDLEAVSRLVELAQEDEDEEAILLML